MGESLRGPGLALPEPERLRCSLDSSWVQRGLPANGILCTTYPRIHWNPSVSLHSHPTWGQLWDLSLEVVLGMMFNSCAAEQFHIWVWAGRRRKKSQSCAGEDRNGTLKIFGKVVANDLFMLFGKGLCHRHLQRSAWLNCFFFPSWYIQGEVIKQVQAASFQSTTVRSLHKKRGRSSV